MTSPVLSATHRVLSWAENLFTTKAAASTPRADAEPVRPEPCRAEGRVRFSGAHRLQLPGSRCRVRVRLEAPSTHTHVVGTAEGSSSLEDQLRSAAEATLDALRQMPHAKDVVFELRELTTFDAFGRSGVMVSLKGQYHNDVRVLTGFSPIRDAPHSSSSTEVQVDIQRRTVVQVANVAQAVALAVLSGTNRMLSAHG